MHPAKEKDNLLVTKQHFQILDGLRGIAAMAVVVFHFMEFIIPDYKDNFIAHGYLAVDFFFCLSGFVIAYAYDNRIQKAGAGVFLKLRLIRLHPLVIVGSVLGLICFMLDPFSNLSHLYAGKLFLMFIMSCLLIPYPIVKERYFNLFHLNPPTWSLFWEYVANIFYAYVFVRLHKPALWVLTSIAAVLLCYEAYQYTHLSIGWSGDNFWGGGARVFYSFLAGMLVYRSNWIIKSKLGFLSLSILLMLAFLTPFTENLNWLIDPLIVLFYFPFLIMLGAGAQLRPVFKKACVFSGEISYPLYMTHYPFLWIFGSYLELNKPGMNEMIIIACIGSLLLIGFAYIIMIRVDIPLRTWLKSKVKMHKRER